jgi:transcription elongation factor Elf1
MHDNRYKFPANCPYCRKHSDLLFGPNQTGENFVDCEHCGRTYAIKIILKPETVCVYALVAQKEK